MAVDISYPMLRLLGALLTSTLLCVGCVGSGRPSPVISPGASVDLTSAPPIELRLPPDSRGGATPSDRIELQGWIRVPTQGSARWTTSSPIRPRALFFHGPPGGTLLVGPNDKPVRYNRHQGGRISWSMDVDRVQLGVLGGHAFTPRDYTLVSPVSTKRERRLNLRWSGLTPQEFMHATVFNSGETLRGLLLPAPSSASFELLVPPAAELTFRPGLVRPEIADLAESDGAIASIDVDDNGVITHVWQAPLTPGTFDPVRVNLDRWAGRTVRLRVTTTPGANPINDYVFLAAPQVYSRRKRPKRVVLVFVDTLRQDHLGVYGYDRSTSANLDRWATGAAVYTNARSIAPWTLPSFRATMIGDQPNLWSNRAPLSQTLSDRGWATGMIAGNMYLASNFQGSRGFNEHVAHDAPTAEEQVDRALTWLSTHDGHDAMLLVHFMDPHLPYKEPAPWRSRFAGPAPTALGESFVRSAVNHATLSEDDKRWIIGRYDNNIAYVDHAVSRLLAALDDDTLVVLFSDHGEEFWDHGRFEHGHSLNDELLRVPLLVKGPGVAPGTFDQTVSLMDVAPTVLHHLGLPQTSASRGSSLFAPPIDRGPLGFGYPLYGSERWGVLSGTTKYQVTKGVERLFELTTDPTEHSDLWFDEAPNEAQLWRDRLAQAHGRQVLVGWRAAWSPTRRKHLREPVELTLNTDAANVWMGANPTGHASGELERNEQAVQMTWAAGRPGRELLLASPGHSTPPTDLVLRRGDGPKIPLPLPSHRLRPNGDPRPVARHIWRDGAAVEVTFSVGPGPLPPSQRLIGYDPELNSMLQAGGYAVGDESVQESPAQTP